MNKIKIGIVNLSLLGLIACGGGGGGAKTPIVEISTSGINAQRILVGSSHSLDRSYYVHADFINADYYDAVAYSTATIAQLPIIQKRLNELEGTTSTTSISYSISATSSNPDVAKIENGKLVGVSPGKANISYSITSDSIALANPEVGLDAGEFIVCPYDRIVLSAQNGDNNTYDLSNDSEPREITSTLEGITLIATPIISDATLASVGLTPSDCPTLLSSGNYMGMISEIYSAHYINHVSYDNDGNTVMNMGFASAPGAVNTITGLDNSEPGSAAVKVLGLDFPNITRTIIDPNDISNVSIVELGYGNHIANSAANPIKIVGFSSSLKRDVDLTAAYLKYGYTNTSLSLPVSDSEYCGHGEYCLEAGSQTAAITLSGDDSGLPDVTSATLPVVEPVVDFSIYPKTAPIDTEIEMSLHLIIDGTKYDASSFITQNGQSLTSVYEHFTGERISFGKWFIYKEKGQGYINTFNHESQVGNRGVFKIGQATEKNIQERWLQVDNGQDYYIGAYDPVDFTPVNENQLTYQTTDNTTATLLRAGIDNVAVSGSVNIVEEAATPTSALKLLSFKTSAEPKNVSLKASGRSTAGIDVILENANTGDIIEIAVGQDGTFSEDVPTGVYNVDGTVVDGNITYVIDTQITIERDAIDAGRLSLAKVGLYNFETSITGCEYGYKCYAGQPYTFTITAKNTGFIASSGIQASIGDISGHPNVTAFSLPDLPISGAARGDSIEYTFTATFSQPAQDTVIEVPITLKDAKGRTWENIVNINLSQYSSKAIDIKAYNAGKKAEVRGYLMLEGRTPIRVEGSAANIKVPNKPGASYELIIANQTYNDETPYGVANNNTLSNADFSGFNDLSRNESSDDTAAGAQNVDDTEKFISYISAGDIDHYLINIPAAL